MISQVATFSAEERTECGVLLEDKTVEDEPDQNVEVCNRIQYFFKFNGLFLVSTQNINLNN